MCAESLLERLVVGSAQGCANVREDQVKLVMGIDGRPTGEAFVEISGPGSNLALALSKDRQVMPVRAASLKVQGLRVITLPKLKTPVPIPSFGVQASLVLAMGKGRQVVLVRWDPLRMTRGAVVRAATDSRGCRRLALHLSHGCGAVALLSAAMLRDVIPWLSGLAPSEDSKVTIECCVGLQNSSRYVEIFSSNREEMERRPLTGGMLV